MTLNLEQLARAMGAAGGPFEGSAAEWSVDSRTQAPGGVYFALRGERHDGQGQEKGFLHSTLTYTSKLKIG